MTSASSSTIVRFGVTPSGSSGRNVAGEEARRLVQRCPHFERLPAVDRRPGAVRDEARRFLQLGHERGEHAVVAFSRLSRHVLNDAVLPFACLPNSLFPCSLHQHARLRLPLAVGAAHLQPQRGGRPASRARSRRSRRPTVTRPAPGPAPPRARPPRPWPAPATSPGLPAGQRH